MLWHYVEMRVCKEPACGLFLFFDHIFSPIRTSHNSLANRHAPGQNWPAKSNQPDWPAKRAFYIFEGSSTPQPSVLCFKKFSDPVF